MTNKSPSKIGQKSERDKKGRFRPGSTGGPGRREGSRNKVSVMMDQLAEQNALAILERVVTRALSGDPDACELVLKRCWPVPKGRRVALPSLPPAISTPGDVVAALSSILSSVASGEVSPDEGQAVAALVDGQRKAIETVDLERRISELERKDESK